MKTEFTDKEMAELVPAARAAVGGESENAWTQLGEFFDKQREGVKKLVEPRPTKETN